jgi:hypothetical protein
LSSEFRLICGFTLPPLLVPIFAGIWPPTHGVFGFIFGVFAAYGGMIIFGVPAYFILRRKTWAGLPVAVGLGAIFGAIIWFAVGALFVLSLGENLDAVSRMLTDENWRQGALWPAAPLGAAVAIGSWLIIRPDRR